MHLKSAPSADQCIFVGGVPIFFYFHIWTTEVIPYNALNSEFANFETPCIIINYSKIQHLNEKNLKIMESVVTLAKRCYFDNA
jgi:hypothetical protein